MHIAQSISGGQGFEHVCVKCKVFQINVNVPKSVGILIVTPNSNRI